MPERIGPCDNCGLCCEHLLVQADAGDVLREPQIDAARPLSKRSPGLSLLDACWILAGPGMPCAFLTPRKRCSIYPTRPQVCVAFALGSIKCQQLRREHGLAPVLPRSSAYRILNEIRETVIAEEAEDPGLR